ncbi:orexin receptor type 1-like [Copidosoma floridanum]|uniref:orexin receptor type 1-like n=1 Tax=Copidosoma floridanum TaxID=29053 RepID=UPI0006C954E0|nr:orexin receptor type 1-like [Copidosoma floridanum]
MSGDSKMEPLVAMALLTLLASSEMAYCDDLEGQQQQQFQDDPDSGNCSGVCTESRNATRSQPDNVDIVISNMYQYISPLWYEYIFIIMHGIVFITGLMGNVLVCVAVMRAHMRTVTNYFIMNLALADLLVILTCLPFTITWDITETWFFGLYSCKIVLYFQTVSVTVSVGTLVYISFDRWYAIRSPLKFKSTTSRAKKVIFIIWMLALTIDIPELIAYRTFSLIPSPEVREKTNLFTQCGPDWEISTQLYAAWVKFVGLYVVPLMLISFAYLQIARVLWSGEIPGHNLSARIVNSNQLSSQASMGNTECQLKSRRKAAKMLLAVVLVFAICCLPVHFFSIYRFSTPVKATPLANIISCLVHWLFYANSAINPLIYNFMSGKFRKEFKRTFANCCSPTGNHNRSVYRVAGNVSKNLQSVRSTSCNNSMHTRFALTIFSNNNNTSNNNLRHSTEIVPLSGICNSPNGMQQQSVGNHSVVTYQ